MNKVELLNDIFRLCIVPLLAVLTGYLVSYIQKKSEDLQNKIDNDMADKYIVLLTDIIVDCVTATNQTYVEALKKENAFTKEAQVEAFNKTYNAVMSILSQEAYAALRELYGDVPTLIKQMIESIVHENK